MRWIDEDHRAAHCCRNPTSFSTGDHRCRMKRFSPARKLRVLWHAAHRNHIGFYPTPSAVKNFAKDLSKFATAKGSIQFPLEKPLPLPLIHKITAFRVRESIEKDRKWRT